MLIALTLTATLTLQDSTRVELAPATHELISPELQAAMEEVFRFDRRLLDLQILDINGVPSSPVVLERDPRVLEFFVNGEATVFPGVKAFAFGENTPHFDQVLECGRHNRGIIAARRMIAENPKLSVFELLRVIDDAFLGDDPVEGSERAKGLHGFAKKQLRLAPLSNASVSYVLWGLLHSQELWKDKATDRELCISELIERGATSQLSGLAVSRILEAPLLIDPEKESRGVSFYIPSVTGKVGFTHQHRMQLEALIKLVADSDKDMAPGPSPFDTHVISASADGSVTEVAPAQLGHLRTWAPEILWRALFELEPEQANAIMKRAGTIDERMTYWTALTTTVPFAIFRELMLEEIRLMVAGEDEHPLSQEIKELEVLEGSGVIAPEQQRRLDSLRLTVVSDQRTMVQRLTELAVTFGRGGEFEAVASTLGSDLHQLLEPGTLVLVPGTENSVPQQLLQFGWLSLASSGNPDSHPVLEQLLDGELDYPAYGTTQLISQLSAFKHPGYVALLDRIVTEGTPTQRASALINSQWISPDRYSSEILRVLQDCRDQSVVESERELAWSGAMTSLSGRPKTEAKTILVQSIQTGQWKATSVDSRWIYKNSFFTDWALEQLTPEEKAEFIQQGLLDSSLK